LVAGRPAVQEVHLDNLGHDHRCTPVDDRPHSGVDSRFAWV